MLTTTDDMNGDNGFNIGYYKYWYDIDNGIHFITFEDLIQNCTHKEAIMTDNDVFDVVDDVCGINDLEQYAQQAHYANEKDTNVIVDRIETEVESACDTLKEFVDNEYSFGFYESDTDTLNDAKDIAFEKIVSLAVRYMKEVLD